MQSEPACLLDLPVPSAPPAEGVNREKVVSDIWLLSHMGDQRYALLKDAAETGKLEHLKVLLEMPISRDKMIDGKTPLHAAVMKGHTEAVSLLLDAKANVNTFCQMEATHVKNNYHITGTSPLSLAAALGNEAIVDLLIDAKADVQFADRGGFAPIFAATKFNRTSVIEQLLKAKADPKCTGGAHKATPLHMAASRGHAKALNILSRYVDPDIADEEGKTALFYAVGQHQHDAVHYLIYNRANPDKESDINRERPLHAAVKIDNIEAARILLDAKASIDAVNSDGQTPLLTAVIHNNAKSVQLLLEAGAETKILDQSKRDVYQVAKERNDLSPELKDILFKNEPKKKGFLDIVRT